MNGYYRDVAFKHDFRDYQKKLLDSLDDSLKDRRVHIVAAPGSGKTVLGLEVIRRLDEKALILVPTLNLRRQWEERFLDLFAGEENRSRWERDFSRSLISPGILTCATYQALYSLHADQEGGSFKKLIRDYRKEGVKVLCLDEAHHLKREWWKALTEFAARMDMTLICLTATPPMDSSDLEWKRYMELCGEIDREIFIPEMVEKHCLCPHQDYIYLCMPNAEETEKIKREQERNEGCMNRVLREPEMLRQVSVLKPLTDPYSCADFLAGCPQYLTDVLSYLAYLKKRMWLVELAGGMEKADHIYDRFHPTVRKLLNSPDLPDMDMEHFLSFMRDILYLAPQYISQELRDSLRERMTENHLIRAGRMVGHQASEKVDRLLRNSASKLDAMTDILLSEMDARQDRLRCVVLMDRIRREDLVKVAAEETLTDLGVVPVFERLRRQEHLGNLETYFQPLAPLGAGRTAPSGTEGRKVYHRRLGVLTGSLVILPDERMEELLRIFTDGKGENRRSNDQELKIQKAAVQESESGETKTGEKENPGRNLRAHPLASGLTGYSMCELPADAGGPVVSAVTAMLNEGKIKVLIGTASLLGEGWDAPSVNVLIIGSSSSSYVKANQMRGRALRMDPADPEKSSDIWHLLTVRQMGEDGIAGTEELSDLSRRFDASLGLRLDGLRIENGLRRMKTEAVRGRDAGPLKGSDNLLGRLAEGRTVSAGAVRDWNSRMKELSSDFDSVREMWKRAEAVYDDFSRVRNVVQIPAGPVFSSDRGLSAYRLRRMAETLLLALKKAGLVREPARLVFCGEKDRCEVFLEETSEHESGIFAQAMKEMTMPAGAARYLLRTGIFRKSYLVVPGCLEKKKDLAMLLLPGTGPFGKLIFTRTVKGRRKLLDVQLAQGRVKKQDVQLVKKLYAADRS